MNLIEITERNLAQEGVVFVGVNMRAWMTKYALEQMTRYLSLIQASLSQHFEEIEAAYREDMAGEMTDDEYYILEDHYTDQFIEAGRDFPQRLLSSFIVAWYSFVEQQFLDICENLNLRIAIGPRDSRNLGKGIRRARRFLLEASRYEIHPPHWQELVEIGRLRNFIVHEGARIVGSYLPSEEEMVELQSDIGNTFHFPISRALFRYLQKHDLVTHSSMFLDIIPSFDYCNLLNLARSCSKSCTRILIQASHEGSQSRSCSTASQCTEMVL